MTVWNVGYGQSKYDNLNRQDSLQICEDYIRLSGKYKTDALNFESKFTHQKNKAELLETKTKLLGQKLSQKEVQFEIEKHFLNEEIKSEQRKRKRKAWNRGFIGFGAGLLTGILLLH